MRQSAAAAASVCCLTKGCALKRLNQHNQRGSRSSGDATPLLEPWGGRGANLDSALLSFFPGLIKTALPGMDREVKENYQVVIQAKDMAGQMGGLSGTTTVSIALSDVNDNPPRFTKSESSECASAHLVSVFG